MGRGRAHRRAAGRLARRPVPARDSCFRSAGAPADPVQDSAHPRTLPRRPPFKLSVGGGAGEAEQTRGLELQAKPVSGWGSAGHAPACVLAGGPAQRVGGGVSPRAWLWEGKRPLPRPPPPRWPRRRGRRRRSAVGGNEILKNPGVLPHPLCSTRGRGRGCYPDPGFPS